MKFVFDLDGTICFNGVSISERISNCLEDLRRKGHEVIFASARPVRDMLPVLPERFHRCPLIGANGALVFKDGKKVHAVSFTAAQRSELLRLIGKYDADYLADSEWDYAYRGPADHAILKQVDSGRMARQVEVNRLETIIKILILAASDEAALGQELEELDLVVHRHHRENALDLSPKGIHKGQALQALGVRPHHFIAFGNDANDLTMFQQALHSVMIGDHPELAAYATERIALEGDYEQQIIRKIAELSASYPASLQEDLTAR